MNYAIQGLPTWSSCSLSLRYSLQKQGEAAAFTASLTGCECVPMTTSLSQPLRGRAPRVQVAVAIYQLDCRLPAGTQMAVDVQRTLPQLRKAEYASALEQCEVCCAGSSSRPVVAAGAVRLAGCSHGGIMNKQYRHQQCRASPSLHILQHHAGTHLGQPWIDRGQCLHTVGLHHHGCTFRAQRGALKHGHLQAGPAEAKGHRLIADSQMR